MLLGTRQEVIPMATILVLYATVEGQTGLVAEKMAQRLLTQGHTAETCAVRVGEPGTRLTEDDAVIVGGSIHYGRHCRHLRALVRRHRDTLESKPCAFFSVSLSAGGPGAKSEAAKRYLDAFLHEAGWRPQQTAIFAGAIRYSQYGAFKRRLMQLFVGLAGGETDTSRDYEYTDWEAVEEFTEAFSSRLATPP